GDVVATGVSCSERLPTGGKRRRVRHARDPGRNLDRPDVLGLDVRDGLQLQVALLAVAANTRTTGREAHNTHHRQKGRQHPTKWAVYPRSHWRRGRPLAEARHAHSTRW